MNGLSWNSFWKRLPNAEEALALAEITDTRKLTQLAGRLRDRSQLYRGLPQGHRCRARARQEGRLQTKGIDDHPYDR